MTRSNARELAVHFVFEMSFTRQTAEELLGEAMTRPVFERIGREEPLYAEFPNLDQRAYIETLVRGVESHREELDGYISQYAIDWSFSRLPKVTVAILRVCMFEILYMGDVPNAAAINEAVELTKRYEQPEMAAFVNGILGSFVRAGHQAESPVAHPAPETFSPQEDA